MRLYHCTTDTGCSGFLFAIDEQRAVQLFATYVVLSEERPTGLSIREVTLATELPERRQHLAEALAHGIEAFASYELGSGWEMTLVQTRFDQLSNAAGEGAGVR